MDELDKIFQQQELPISEPVQWWQLDRIEQMLELCYYPPEIEADITNNLPTTKEEANILLQKLWFDHIQRDPKDQLDKMIKLKTLI